MDAGDWIALGGTVLALVFQSIGVAIYLTRVASQVQQNVKAIERLERSDAECEGRMSGMRQEFESRAERLSNRVTESERAQTEQTNALGQAFSKLEATLTGGLVALKESVDRLHDERARAMAQPPQNDFIAQLRQFVELQNLMKKVA